MKVIKNVSVYEDLSFETLFKIVNKKHQFYILQPITKCF